MGLKDTLKQSDSLAMGYRLLKRLYIRYVLRLRHVHPTFNVGGKCSISGDFVAGEYAYAGPKFA